MLNSKKLVSIVIPNWNGKEHLRKCLGSLAKPSYPDFEIILVDSALTRFKKRRLKSASG